MTDIVLLIGPVCAGTGLASKFFSKKGYDNYGIGDLVRDECLAQGWELGRSNEDKMGYEMREKYGADIWMQRAYERAQKTGKACIEGLRTIPDFNYFEGRGLFLGINASQQIRWERMKSRNRIGDPKTLEEFKQKDMEHRAGPIFKIDSLLPRCSYVIRNDTDDQEALFFQISEALSQFNGDAK